MSSIQLHEQSKIVLAEINKIVRESSEATAKLINRSALLIAEIESITRKKQTTKEMRVETFASCTEYTFQTVTNEEFMVWFEDGKPVEIYTYRDTKCSLSILKWQQGRNPLFVHCPINLIDQTWEWLQNNTVYLDNEND